MVLTKPNRSDIGEVEADSRKARAEDIARISVVDRASKNKAQPLPGETPMRLHLRRFMAVIFLVATILGLAVPAIEVYIANEHHVHQGIEISGTPTLASWAGIRPRSGRVI